MNRKASKRSVVALGVTFLAVISLSAIVTASFLGIIWSQDSQINVVDPSQVYSTLPESVTLMTNTNTTYFISVQNTANEAMTYELVIVATNCDARLSNGTALITVLPGNTAVWYPYIQTGTQATQASVTWQILQSTVE